MLIACQSCHRQYDVGGMEPGSKIRCFCGEANVVPRPREREAIMLHCSSCGGTLKEGATQCEYCRSEITLGEKGLGEVCPECFARMVKEAKYCSGCGVAIKLELVVKGMTSQSCPRCDGALALCEGGDVAFSECTSCGGLWLDEKVFRHFVDKREVPPSLPDEEFGAPKSKIPVIDEKESLRYLKCPVCAGLMQRRNFGSRSGVIIDWCGGHGFWFDTHEMERIIAFVDANGLEEARRALDDRAGVVPIGSGISGGDALFPPDVMAELYRSPKAARSRFEGRTTALGVLVDVLAVVVGRWLR